MKNGLTIALSLLLMCGAAMAQNVPSKPTDWLTIQDAAQRITNLSIGEGKMCARIAKLEAWRDGISRFIEGSLNEDLTKLTADSERAHKSLVSHAARMETLVEKWCPEIEARMTGAEKRMHGIVARSQLADKEVKELAGATTETVTKLSLIIGEKEGRIVSLERKVAGMQRAINALMSKTGTSLPSTTHGK